MGDELKAKRNDPGSLTGEALGRWYQRSPEDVEGERRLAEQLEFDAYNAQTRRLARIGDDVAAQRVADAYLENTDSGTWQEARLAPPPVRPPLRRPEAPRAGFVPRYPSAPARTQGGFFGAFDPVPNPNLGPAYLTGLPAPLGQVEPRGRDLYKLSDGSLVSATEVERLYAEQQLRIAGQEDAEPAPYARRVDRLRDGSVPVAAQLRPREREYDPTCHPNGGWELDANFPKYPERTKRFETQITGAAGVDYVVRNPGERPVKFDGCAVWSPRRELLEAKGPGYDALIDAGSRYGFLSSITRKAASQMGRQGAATQGRLINWHVAEPGANDFFSELRPAGAPITVQHTPAK